MGRKGKNFSCNNSKGLRKKSDFYETPYSLSRLFLSEYRLGSSEVVEPACGMGAITKVLKEFGYNTLSCDISDGCDFLTHHEKCHTIMTNPPFSLALEFIEKAKTLCEEFVFLLPLTYLHGKERFDKVYSDSDFPLREVWVFTRYPLLGEKLREDGKINTGMMVYAWFVWRKGKTLEPPVIKWLDNNSYILTKKDT